jgi:hypothetical protein
MKRIASLLFLSAMMLLAAPAIQATPMTFVADLTGPSEAPPNASPGTGFAIVIFDDVAHLLSVHATFSGLLGNTTASHIHCCVVTPGAAPESLRRCRHSRLPIGVTAGVYDMTFDTSLASTWNPAFITALVARRQARRPSCSPGSWMERRTSIFIPTCSRRRDPRFLRAPEPATLALLCCGLLALGSSSATGRADLRQSGGNDPPARRVLFDVPEATRYGLVLAGCSAMPGQANATTAATNRTANAAGKASASISAVTGARCNKANASAGTPVTRKALSR